MTDFLPLIIAFITAITALFGYIYEKRKEREFQLRETRKDIHKQLIANFMEMQVLYGKANKDPDLPPFDSSNPNEHFSYIEVNHPKLWENIFKGKEIGALMSVYGTDESIKAVAEFWKQSIKFGQDNSSNLPPNFQAMILHLRQSLFPETTVTQDDILFMVLR